MSTDGHQANPGKLEASNLAGTPIRAVILFGSAARGDAGRSSDVDLLLITPESHPRHTTMGNLSLSLYSARELLKRARKGNLFVCHIVQEGKVIYDESNYFQRLKDAFALRKSYAHDTRRACDVGWLIVERGRTLTRQNLVARRIAWCVRTILIARTAERGRPIFSPAALVSEANFPDAEMLIRHRSRTKPARGAVAALRRFLIFVGCESPLPPGSDAEAWRTHFANTGNAVGRHLLHAGMSTQASYE
ncbi:MAG: nucleotidyltransferase domain-containing protein [Ignavibacteriales bacterium]